jgi:hypothetical protein
MRPALLAVLLSASACASSNSRLVAEFSATATYHVASYEHRCQGTGGHYPVECSSCQAIINEAVWQAKVAVTNRDQGYLPPEERADLERLIVALGSCP